MDNLEKGTSNNIYEKIIENRKKLDSLGRYDIIDYDVAGMNAFIGDQENSYKILIV